MTGKDGRSTPSGHILSRFDGDLGRFRQVVLDMGNLASAEVALASEALAKCDIGIARQVQAQHRKLRDLDLEAMEANAKLYAVHQPVARDLRFVLTLSRAVYDLERISGEALRMAEIAESLYELQLSSRDCVIFEDVRRMHQPVADLLHRVLEAVANEDVHLAVDVALGGRDIEDLFKASLRRLATYIMEDPRNIRLVIDGTLGIKAMERIGDHACSIARNLIYSVTGKDVRHSNVAVLAE